MNTERATERAKAALSRLLEMFESGDLPAAVARTMIKPKPGTERPIDRWSLGNRLLALAAGTDDARGFKQWQDVGRRVRKGEKAFYIFAPVTKTKTVKVTDEETGEEYEEERRVVIGFREVPVFRLDDTEGDPLPEPDYAPPELPPLYNIARQFGVEEVIYEPGDGNAYGYFTWRNGRKIVLHTHDVKTWFHELGHAVHATFRPLQGGQVPEQEIVAEVFAATLCELYGIQVYHKHSWNYVRSYAGEDPQQALKAIFRVLADVEKCLNLVLEAANQRRCAA
ncbi:MAG: ArdC-like ssDNA-binding domain-containing protein [Thermoanaerobacterales bacterium]|nr:ArdC-like ssDNA-binding domain-containing protein [Thermoanaerobacterales bacterium]